MALTASASTLVALRSGPRAEVSEDGVSSAQSVPSTIVYSSSPNPGFEDLEPAEDLGYLLATSHSILTVEKVIGETGEPLQLLPDEPYVKLSVAAQVSQVQFINEERLVQWKQRSNVRTGEISLELAASSIEQGRKMLGTLQQLKPPFYVAIMGVPPLPNNPDGGLEIRAVYQVSAGSVRFALPGPGLSEDVAGVARILNRPASADLIVDWATELNATAVSGSVGPIARAHERVAQEKVGSPPPWDQLNPRQRSFNDTMTPPPLQ